MKKYENKIRELTSLNEVLVEEIKELKLELDEHREILRDVFNKFGNDIHKIFTERNEDETDRTVTN